MQRLSAPTAPLFTCSGFPLYIQRPLATRAAVSRLSCSPWRVGEVGATTSVYPAAVWPEAFKLQLPRIFWVGAMVILGTRNLRLRLSPGNSVFVGRDPRSCQILIGPDDTRVSRQHLRFWCEEVDGEMECLVEDISSNGTWMRSWDMLWKLKRGTIYFVEATDMLYVRNPNRTDYYELRIHSILITEPSTAGGA